VPFIPPKQPLNNRGDRMNWNKKMQALACKWVYPLVWPDYKIWSPSRGGKNTLARALDVGGTDIMLSTPEGVTIHIADRFRQYAEFVAHPDFTLRGIEYERHLRAIQIGGALPFYYTYGYANEEDTDFAQVFIVLYDKWLRDVAARRTWAPRLKDRTRYGQENFRYIAWRSLPHQYLFYSSGGPFVQENVAA
jgi:hypothetical protein